MLVIRLLRARRYLAPAGETDANADRGDDFIPTGDDTPADKTGEKKPDAKTGPPGGDGEDPDKDLTDEEKAQAAAAKEKKGVIPRDRHEKVLAAERSKREALERQIAAFQGAKEVVKVNEEISSRETKLVDLDKAYTKAMTDGETEKAADLMRQIRTLDREISNLDAQGKIAAAEARAVETTRYNIALDRVEQTYPELNEDHDDFEQDTYDEVVDLMKAYRASGRTPTEALQKAVKMVLGAKTAAEKAATTVTPRVNKEDVDPATLRAERKKGAVDKALDAAAKSPATATAKTGTNNDADGAALQAKDVVKMKYEKFIKLSDEDLAQARGDEYVGS